MLGKRLRSTRMRAAVIAILPLLLTGCFFNLREKEDFKSWYYGDPGLAGALGEERCDRYADNIEGPRHPYYLHLRTPEVLLQPQGGAHYPERQTAESRVGGTKVTAVRCEKAVQGWETFRFDAVDAGLVDTVVPYRKASVVNRRDRGVGRESLAYAEGVLYNTGLAAVMKAPIYIVHDILKTLYIPVAGTYYLLKPDVPTETTTEFIEVRDETLADPPPLAAADAAHKSKPDDTGDETAAAETPAETPTEPAVDDAVTATDTEAATSPTVTADTPDEDEAAAAIAAAKPEPAAEVPMGDHREPTDGPEASEAPAMAAQGSEGAPHEEAPAAPETKVAPDASPPAMPPTKAGGAGESGPERQAEDAPMETPSMPGSPNAEIAAAPEASAREAEEGPIPADEQSDSMIRTDGPAGDGETAAPGAAVPTRDDVTVLPPDTDTDSTPATAVQPEPDTRQAASAAGTTPTPGDEPAASDAPRADAARDSEPIPAEAAQAPSTPDESASAAGLPPETPPSGEATDPSVGEAVSAAPAPAPTHEAEEEPPPAFTATPDEAQTTAPAEARADPGTATDQEAAAASEPPPDGTEGETEAAVAEAAPVPEQQADRSQEEDSVDSAVTTLTAIAKDGTAAEEEAPLPTAEGGESGAIVEEDLLNPASPEDDSPTVEGQGALDAADPPGAPRPAETDTAPDSMVSVSPDEHAVPPETPAPLKAIEKVPVWKRKLRKKVAFIGFYSRAVNVDAKTKAGLQALVWPVLEKECKPNLTLVRQGDQDYPAALDNLIRDPFGHLNSFELTTVARFSGLNAIIAGTIIDIRVSKELGGILWYKSPEGQLRLTIQVEVFDAETGTKIFDHTYIREEEVEELEPGAGEKPRKEDLPILEAALQDVARDMGDHVCDALEDQPWRAFVSGINGARITLSSGQSAGLKPGNILGAYNSQIIDGLNNQQFFLTGEKVGRIQIIDVDTHRSEAILIEGKGLRDYSVVIPE